MILKVELSVLADFTSNQLGTYGATNICLPCLGHICYTAYKADIGNMPHSCFISGKWKQ